MDALTASYRVFTCFMPVSLIKFSLISPGFRSFDITREENLRIQNSFSNDQAKIIFPINLDYNRGGRDATILGGGEKESGGNNIRRNSVVIRRGGRARSRGVRQVVI